jgi:membrane fusion protein (multidrug efflux system)
VTLFFYLHYKKTHISTDDAFVDGNIHSVASKVPGTVMVIHVKDNQFVRKDEILLEIDPADYNVKLLEAQAGLEAEKTRLSEIQATIETARKRLGEVNASLEAARATLELQEANSRLAQIELKRAESLIQKKVLPKEQYDRAKTAYDVAAAQVKTARENIKQLEASLGTQQGVVKQTESSLPPQRARIKQKEAVLKGAELNKGYTRIYAPSDGYISKKTVQLGNQVRAGQPLMAVVPLDDIWITANYKETQLEKVKPGQKVQIEVDTYPGEQFNGRVESIMAGTGAVFSIFPPENATGNYVKVVQRIPVKILLDKGSDPEYVLRIGMSVVPTILVGQ